VSIDYDPGTSGFGNYANPWDYEDLEPATEDINGYANGTHACYHAPRDPYPLWEDALLQSEEPPF
jgi:hypothetical protein